MSTEVAKTERKQKTLKDWLQSDQFHAAVQKASPKHFDPDRLLQIAVTAMQRTPKLNECDQASFLNCLLMLSEYGLRPNGRDAHLIPFRDNRSGKTLCQLIVDYKGYVSLCYASGKVKSIRSNVVYSGDSFDYTSPEDHVPYAWRSADDRPDDRGVFVGAYCVVELTQGGQHTEIMTAEEIEKVRTRSRAGGHGPWQTDFDEMAKKTVFRRATKWLPLGSDLQIAEEEDDRYEPIEQPRRATGPSGLRGLEARLTDDPVETEETREE